MNNRARRVLGILLWTLPLALVACGDSDKSVGPKPGENLPRLEVPSLQPHVHIHPQSPAAEEAEALIHDLLQGANEFGMENVWMISPLTRAEWAQGSGGCVTWTYVNQADCSLAYEVCNSEVGFEWDVTLNGTCDGDTVIDRAGFHAETSKDGTSGTFETHGQKARHGGYSWTWNFAPDGKTKVWNIFEGEPEAGNAIGTARHVEFADGTQLHAWEAIEDVKFDCTMLATDLDGSMKIYEWGGDWVLLHEITWHLDESGSWITYDAEGNTVETRSW